MASRNADSITSAQGEVHPSKPRDEPLTTHGVSSPLPPSLNNLKVSTVLNSPFLQHKPGVLEGNDTKPEFHAQTLPPGSAPSNRTFKPDATSEIPGQALNEFVERQHGKESTKTTASSTLGGATSGDVHTGLGKPLQGQTTNELAGGNNLGGHGGGLVGVGASGAASGNQAADERTQPSQRGLEKEGGELAGKKGDKATLGAEDLPNEEA
ncbi:MAG: hypothetical protein LQ351_003624 [Letrouitia transgressa]|nr:MAG: hypothetical protein LQ351_003624 [Letrouitia transgressa]